MIVKFCISSDSFGNLSGKGGSGVLRHQVLLGSVSTNPYTQTVC